MCDVLLSIIILTMNRCEQMAEAFESCIASALPTNTEFVIVDNHSTDQTKDTIKKLQIDYPGITIRAFYLDSNLGVGGGRSYGFAQAKGKYLYFMDDDAVISNNSRNRFFLRSIDYLERNSNVASLTTGINDEMFGEDRTGDTINETIDGLPLNFIFLGGSHFLRKAYFDEPLYFKINYSSEEYMPSIKAMDKGYFHVVDKEISIDHHPRINKWIHGSNMERELQIKYLAVTFATKKLLYPIIYQPAICVFFLVREFKYFGFEFKAYRRTAEMVRTILKENHSEKVASKTVNTMIHLFGLTVL